MLFRYEYKTTCGNLLIVHRCKWNQCCRRIKTDDIPPDNPVPPGIGWELVNCTGHGVDER